MKRQPGQLEIALARRLKEHGRKRSTIDVYCNWYYRYMCHLKHILGQWTDPRTVGQVELEHWLTSLACDAHVSPKTQNQAFSAICYLYREVLKTPLENVSALRAKGSTNVRTILDQPEISLLLSKLTGLERLTAMMMYGCGLRIGELALLRIKDFHFERNQLEVHEAKHGKSRLVQLPKSIHAMIANQITSMRVLWNADCQDGLNGVSLPNAYGRKRPAAHNDFAWYYFLCADNYSKCPDSGKLYRHSRDMQHIGKGISAGFYSLGIPKKFSPHTLRHSFATHLLELGTPINYVQQLLGHESLETTMIYLHCCKDRATDSKSPVDFLDSLEKSTAASNTLQSLLANPSAITDLRRDDEEPPRLRVFAG